MTSQGSPASHARAQPRAAAHSRTGLRDIPGSLGIAEHSACGNVLGLTAAS
jgi:hypothetical protein